MEIRKISGRRPRPVGDTELGHFTLLFCRGPQKKCTKIYNARAQLLFCSLDLLFGDVPVTIVVVVCELMLTGTTRAWVTCDLTAFPARPGSGALSKAI